MAPEVAPDRPSETERTTSAPSNLTVSVAIICYALSSLSGVFVNKACLSGFNFAFPMTLMLCQLVFSVSSLSILRLLGVLSIPHRSIFQIASLLYPAVFFILNVFVGLFALKLVNIPMFSAFRRLSVINVMILEYLVLGKTSSPRICFCVFFMVVGSLIAACGDLTFDPLGYALVFANNFVTAANLVSLKRASQLVDLDALALFYYISVLALPLVCALSIGTGELPYAIHDVRTRPELQSFPFLAALSLSAASAFLVNFFTNMCTQVTSALTTSITGQSKNILQTFLGFFTWGYKGGAVNLFGLSVALFASTSFAVVKYQESEASRRERERDRVSETAGVDVVEKPVECSDDDTDETSSQSDDPTAPLLGPTKERSGKE